MAERRDKLGRRIPEFDRSAASKKGMQTRKEKYGDDYHSRISANGGRKRTRGHFGKLKDEGKEAELENISTKAASIRWQDKDSEKGEETNNGVGDSGNRPPVPR